MGKMLYKAILCAVGGIIGWIASEPFMPSDIRDPSWGEHEMLMVFLIFSLIGLAAGAFSGMQKGSRRHMFMSMASGAALGACGGLMGYFIGGMIVNPVFGGDVFTRGAPIPLTMVARTCALAPSGLLLGAAVGLSNLNKRAIVAGAIGGFIGGIVAGMLFDPVSFMFAPFQRMLAHGNEVGAPGRAALGILMGFFVGLFTGLLDFLTRNAWVRLEVGRNEGREWPIDMPQTTIGRDERAVIPLFGDGNVAPLHAIIAKDNGQYVLHDAGSAIGVGMNGMRLPGPVILKPGDLFQVGTHNLRFLTKEAGAIATGPEIRPVAVPVGGPGMGVVPTRPTVAPTVAPSTAPYATSRSGPMNAQPDVATLVAITGPLTGQRFPLQGVMEVGREGAGIALRGDAQASRRHASFTSTAAGVALQDLGSTNGTRVNGQVVTSAILKPGDVVQIGASQFRVE